MGVSYDLMATDDLVSGWVPVATNLPAVLPVTTHPVDLSGRTKRYFQVEAKPAP